MKRISNTAKLLAIALEERLTVGFRVSDQGARELHLRVGKSGTAISWAQPCRADSSLASAVEALAHAALADLEARPAERRLAAFAPEPVVLDSRLVDECAPVARAVAFTICSGPEPLS